MNALTDCSDNKRIIQHDSEIFIGIRADEQTHAGEQTDKIDWMHAEIAVGASR